MPAGKMRTLLQFQRRAQSDDGFGTVTTGEFETVFTDYAELIPRMGSEPVFQSRLQGQQPYTVRVRSNAWTREVDATWRVVNARTAAVYSIVSPSADLTQKNQYLEFLAVVGGGGQ